MKAIALFITLTMSASVFAEDKKEYADYNFDGHQDYRVLRESNGKQHYFDVFLFDGKTKQFVKNEALSHVFNPEPDAKTKEIRCRASGGHSGAIYIEEVYRWKGNGLELIHTVQQTNLMVGGKIRYVRVTMEVVDGSPHVSKLEMLGE